jgi:hypothetical protein
MLYCNCCIHELSQEDLGLLDMTYVFKKDNYYYSFFTTDHLAVYRAAGIEFRVHSGVAWKQNECMSTSYKTFINDMFQKRKRNMNNPVLNNMYKLVMNGAFGSTGLRAIETKHVMISNHQFTLDDTNDVPIVNYRIHHKYTDVAYIKNIIGVMKDKNEIPNQLLIKLKAMKGHAFKELSCKSSCTSRVTSGAFRYMMQILMDAGASLHRSFVDMLQELHYMDTDSLFLPTPIARSILQLEPYCHSAELGGVKNDYGEGGVILYMTAPLAKVRKMVILTPLKNGKYTLKYVCKFKGLPMGPEVHHTVFESMMRDLGLEESKTVWNRNLQGGVSTHETSYKVDFKNTFLKSKSGIQLQSESTTGGAHIVRLLPPYHVGEEKDNDNTFYFQGNEDAVMKKISDLFTFTC